MDIYAWIIFLYVAGTALLAWFLLHELMPGSLQESVSYLKKQEIKESLQFWNVAHNREILTEKFQWGNYEDAA